MKALFMIRDKVSGAFCQSTHGQLFDGFAKAETFETRKKAERAVSKLCTGRGVWYLYGKMQRPVIEHGDGGTPRDLEIVECVLTLKA